ncbi:MAG: hypothetical protein ACF8QF_08360 [Phycisphaerales bacterium]
MTNRDDHQTPADLQALERELDALAADERTSAPAGLEQRVALATARALRNGPAPVARIGFAGVGWRRLAAAVALVAGAGLIVVATTQRLGPGAATPEALETASIEAEVEAWLADPFLDEGGDSFASLREELDGFDATLGAEAFDDADPLSTLELESVS